MRRISKLCWTSLSLDNDEKKKYKGFSSNSRKLEFLSVRALLSELIGKEAKIVYNKNNKPFLKDGSRFISISHSHKLTSILLSTNEKVGIDLEYMSTNIAAIAFKFLTGRKRSQKNRRNVSIIFIFTGAQKKPSIKFVTKKV